MADLHNCNGLGCSRCLMRRLREVQHSTHWWTTSNGDDPEPEATCGCGCGRTWAARNGGGPDAS